MEQGELEIVDPVVTQGYGNNQFRILIEEDSPVKVRTLQFGDGDQLYSKSKKVFPGKKSLVEKSSIAVTRRKMLFSTLPSYCIS